MFSALKSPPIGSHSFPSPDSASQPLFAIPMSEGMHWGKTLVAGACGVMLAGAVLLTAELALPAGVKPSSLLGTAVGNAEFRRLKEVLQATQAEAAALAEEQSRLQREVLAAQADVERVKAASRSLADQEIAAANSRAQTVFEAYKSLYDRSRMVWEAWVKVSHENTTLRSNLSADQQRGRTLSVQGLDVGVAVLSAFGADEISQRLREQRDELARSSVQEVEAVMNRPLPTSKFTEWVNLPDPAAMQAGMAAAQLAPQAREAAPVFVEPRRAPPEAQYRPNDALSAPIRKATKEIGQ